MSHNPRVQASVSAMTRWQLARLSTNHGPDPSDPPDQSGVCSTGAQYPSSEYIYFILHRVYKAYHHGDLMLPGCRTLICRVEPEWDRAVCRLERELVETVRAIDK